MPKGTVKFFNEAKGFGFITPKDGGKDVFVHVSGLNGDTRLNEGDFVEYEVTQAEKGPCATKVRMSDDNE